MVFLSLTRLIILLKIISFLPITLGNVYSENSACVGVDGKLLFGTNYGLLVIDPDKIQDSETFSSGGLYRFACEWYPDKSYYGGFSIETIACLFG